MDVSAFEILLTRLPLVAYHGLALIGWLLLAVSIACCGLGILAERRPYDSWAAPIQAWIQHILDRTALKSYMVLVLGLALVGTLLLAWSFVGIHSNESRVQRQNQASMSLETLH